MAGRKNMVCKTLLLSSWWLAAGMVRAQPPIGAQQLVQQGIRERRYDRAHLPRYLGVLRQATAAGPDSLAGWAAYAVGRTYQALARPDSASRYLALAARTGQRGGFLTLLIRANANRIDLLSALGRPDSAAALAARMRALYPRTRPQTEARARLDVLLGTDYQRRSQYAPALRHELLNLAYQRRVNDSAAIAISLINTGEVFYVQENYPQALRYGREALRWATRVPSLRSKLPELYAHLAKPYIDLGQLDSARQALQHALRLLGPAPENTDEASLYHANLAEVLAQQRRFGLARQHAQDALRRLAGSENGDTRLRVYFFAGEVALRAGRYAEARQLLRRSYALARQVGVLDNLQAVLRMLAEAEAHTGHPAEAYRLAAAFMALRDSSVNQQGQQALAAMEARYQNQDKQRQIAQLARENRLRQAEVAAQRRATALALAGGAVLLLGLAGIGYLLHQRQRTAALLARQNAQLAEANQTKAQLFSIISHDVRAPVSSLFQLLEITLEAPELLDEAARQRQAQRLHQMARDLLGTLDELLLWSKNQLDRLEPVPEPVLLPALLAELEALYAPLAQQRGVALAVACPPGLRLRTDANFLRVVLRNLVQNALKFTPAGGEVALTAAAGPGAATTLRVRDTGPGLPPALLAALRDPATDMPAADPAQGLGLRLTREFVAKLGGRLRAAPAPGGGAELAVELGG